MNLFTHLLVAAAGFVFGCTLLFLLTEARRRRYAEEAKVLAEAASKAAQDAERSVAEAKATAARSRQEAVDAVQAARAESSDAAERAQRMIAGAREAEAAANVQLEELRNKRVSLEQYAVENQLLKRDLLNMGTNLRKLALDERERAQNQSILDIRCRELSERYLADVEKWISANISPTNFAACKQRLVKVIDWCREAGFDVPKEREDAILSQLREDFESEVREALQREEQARIKARLREEQAVERELQKAIDQAAREKSAIEAALARALAETGAAHSAEVDTLKRRLEEAEAANQRAISQAQMTRSGHIYVISNIGAFGDNVFKIGMTRRLEPLDRVAELGDASVPFPFDVHMLISCEDAPALESALHREFHLHRVNKVNPKKEFFKLDLKTIHKFVEARHGRVDYVAEPDALEYRQGLQVSKADQEYIEKVFEAAETSVVPGAAED